MNFIHQLLDIRSTADPESAIERISEGVSIRGYNMWLLFCSAVLASIGLDTSSSAVVIGAMLISPLMSPILGLGLAVGIYDRSLFIRSLQNFSAAVFLSLLASFLYFIISPFGYPTAEIEARTYPTLLDVLIAIFGGIAGIVSSSRSGITIAIPGVAIATALMPPLCTAGYGLATGQWAYFAGAFYLFFINAVCISAATYFIVKYLRFPLKEFASSRQKRQYSWIVAALILLVTLPSIYFLYTVYQRELVNKQINELVIAPIENHGNEVLKWEISDRDSVVWVKVYHSGMSLSDSFKQAITDKLAANRMDEYVLKPFRINMTREEVSAMSTDVSRELFDQLQLQIEVLAKSNEAKADSFSYEALRKETMTAFNYIDTMYNGWVILPDTSSVPDTLPIAFYRLNQFITLEQQSQLYSYLKLRLKKDSVIMVQQGNR